MKIKTQFSMFVSKKKYVESPEMDFIKNGDYTFNVIFN